MSEPSIGRATLNKARLFLEQTDHLDLNERGAFSALLEAAIVFGRSVTFHIQKEFRHRPSFDDWYSVHRTQLEEDPLCRFFAETRNFILKEGPPSVTRTITISIEVIAVAEVSLQTRVIRANPWYRRSPFTIYKDLRRDLIQWARKWRRRIKGGQAEQPRRRETARISQTWHFDHPDWKDRPAPSLIRDYLDKLEPVVSEAEARFGSG